MVQFLYPVMLMVLLKNLARKDTQPCIQSSVEKCNPKPSQKQEEEHEWESKCKPRAKIDKITVWKVAVKDKIITVKHTETYHFCV